MSAIVSEYILNVTSTPTGLFNPCHLTAVSTVHCSVQFD